MKSEQALHLVENCNNSLSNEVFLPLGIHMHRCILVLAVSDLGEARLSKINMMIVTGERSVIRSRGPIVYNIHYFQA